ncbi:tetratricopeptide repeat protein [Gracilimonas sp. Q87]|uniref:tetratricopeptide repeat protein n=1 Tax=Gracilimonas sp. Q87 TaxID=3384766 RepID=UPI003984013D
MLKFILVMLLCYPFTNSAVSAQSYELADGIAFYQGGKFEKAIPQLQKVIEKNPVLIEAYYYLAASHMGLEQYEKVLATADLALNIAPENVQMLVVKAEALYHLDYPKAIPIYKKISELVASQGSNSRSVIKKEQADAYLGHLYKRKANDAFLSGNMSEAINDYKHARDLTPDSLSVHNNLAYTLIQAEKWKEAIEALDKGLQRFPTSEQLLFLKGQAYRGADDRDEMVQTFKILYELYPDNVNYGLIYGQALMASNQARKANEHMNRLIEKYPDNVQIYEALKSMSEQRFDMAAKMNVLKLQRNAFPENRMVALELADTHILLKEYDKARTILDSIETADPSPDIALRSARTTLYGEIDEEALETYRQVLSNWPESYDVLKESALVFRNAGQENEALDLFIKAFQIQEDPKVAVHIIELTDQSNKSAIRQYTHYLQSTPYYALGDYFELKFLDQNLNRSENLEQFISSIVGMLDIFSESQAVLTSQTERVLDGDASPKPVMLQERRFTEKINRYVNAWYDLLKNTFDPDRQINIMESALEEYPSSSRLHFFKGESAFKAGKMSLAKSSLEESIRYGAKDEQVYLRLGDIYRKQDDPENAILFYERSLSIDEKNNDAYRKLIAVSEQSGKLHELCERWLLRYENNNDNNILKEHLISALHKADRFEDAQRIISQ